MGSRACLEIPTLGKLISLSMAKDPNRQLITDKINNIYDGLLV